MKKEDYILILFFLILFSSFFVSNPNTINIIGKSIFDIKATYESLSLSITIDNSSPNVVIYYPLNDTYNHKGNISLNYHASDLYSDMSKIWYNIDNGVNTTLIGNITFSIINDGDHVLYIFANDTLNFLNNSESITFTIDTNLGNNVTLDYDRATTNFSALNKTQQENLNNMTLEKSNFGKIKFNENINLSDDNKEPGYQPIKDVDLISYSNISFNRIEINSNELPQLNKSATLYLYNLTYSNPRILKDSVVCSSCAEESYSNGTLVFNVTGFSVYSAEETPTTPGGVIEGGRGGGGGGGVSIKPLEPIHKKGKIFDVTLLIPDKYRKLYAGETIVSEINIVNLIKVGLVDVNVEYYIEDKDKKVLFKTSEVKSVENVITYIKRIELPTYLNEGYYILYVKVSYKDDIAISGYPFKILEKPIEQPKPILSTKTIKWVGIIFLIVLGSSILIFLIYQGIKKFPLKIKILKKIKKLR